LHYPSDVIAGIAIGVIAAGISLPPKSLGLN
jgi:membrane-associated phospholipid phosphatase